MNRRHRVSRSYDFLDRMHRDGQPVRGVDNRSAPSAHPHDRSFCFIPFLFVSFSFVFFRCHRRPWSMSVRLAALRCARPTKPHCRPRGKPPWSVDRTRRVTPAPWFIGRELNVYIVYIIVYIYIYEYLFSLGTSRHFIDNVKMVDGTRGGDFLGLSILIILCYFFFALMDFYPVFNNVNL